MKTIIKLIKNFTVLSSLAIRIRGGVHPKHFIPKKLWVEKYIKRRDIVLDLGCSQGENSLKVARIAKKIVGVDKNIGKGSGNFFPRVGDLEKKLNFPDNFFDVVLCLDTLEHLHKRDQLMDEARRVLRPGGLLLLSIPNSETGWKKFQRKYGVSSFDDPDHKKEYTLEEAKNVCEKVGLKILDINPTVLDTPLAPLFDIVGAINLSLYTKIWQWKRDRVKGPNWREATGFRIICVK